jgi:hypothetical protein
LATLRKRVLLETYLEIVYNQKYSLINFDINATESTSRSFIHCLLEKGELEGFEVLTKKYFEHIDLSKKDKFNNSALVLFDY